jgi:hypothetical protein
MHYLACHDPTINKCEIVTEYGAIAVTMLPSYEAARDLAEAMNDARERRLQREAAQQQEHQG